MVGGARPVRVNLPAELNGGFTMLMCFMEGGQTISGFIKSLISMLQNTNATLLKPREFGLTPHRELREGESQEDGEARLGPPVFLHPDSLLADAFDDEDELSLDLRRLKPLKPKAAGAPAEPEEEMSAEDKAAAAEAAAAEAAASAARAFRIPKLPQPPAQTVLHYTCLHKLKKLKPPPDPPEEVIVVSTLAAPCNLPYHLARSLPPQLQTAALTHSLSARQASTAAREASAAGGSSHVVAGANSAAVAAAAAAAGDGTRKERKEQLKRAKQLDEYAAHIYDLLLARGVGEDPHLKLQMAANLLAAKSKGERIGTSTAMAGGSEMWGGWENERPKNEDADMLEIPLLFVRTLPLPKEIPKKGFDVTTDCFVITNQRVLQISGGKIVVELNVGIDSGNILKLPKETDDGAPGKCPIHLMVKNAPLLERIEKEEREDGEVIDLEAEDPNEGRKDDGSGDRDGANDDEDHPDEADSRRFLSSKSRASSRAALRASASKLVSFWVPNPDIAGFLEEYLMYFQEKASLESQLGLIEQARLDRIENFKVDRCLKGWTLLLKSLVGPVIFGPLRQPVYENSIKQVLAKVQQMDLKQVKITSLKLLEFRLPELDPVEALGPDGDQIPSLRLNSYTMHPSNEYTFDIFWSAPSFYLKLEISGKKIVSFKLQLEMKGVEVRGSLKLRSSPYEPEKSAVSFVSVPQLSFGVGSHVIVGSIKLPFQRAIEKLIYTQIQAAIENGLKENVVQPKWQSIYYEKSGLGLLLDRSVNECSRRGTECGSCDVMRANPSCCSVVPARRLFVCSLFALLCSWWGMSAYPFKYDGTDDEDMMSLALVVTSQAESGLSGTLQEMRTNREKMQEYLGVGHAPEIGTGAAGSATGASSTKHSNGAGAGAAEPSGSKSAKNASKAARERDRLRAEQEQEDEEADAPAPAAASSSSSSARGKARPQFDEADEEAEPEPPKSSKRRTRRVEEEEEE